jgi:hypothetical protein
MPSLAARAKQTATHKLEQEPFGLRHAEWSAEAVEMILDAEDLGVDPDFTLAATWASATIGAGCCWLDDGGGYGVDDVRRDLGEPLARIVSWTEQEEWQSEDEFLNDLMETGPIEARIIVLAQAMVKTVSGNSVTEEQAGRVMRLAMSIPGLAARVVATGWPVAVVEGEA